jgi:hypothetical protein
MSLIVFVVGVAGHSPSSRAADKKGVQVLLGDADEDAKACGVTAELMKSRANLILRQNNLVEAELTNPWIYVSYNVIKNDAFCVGSLEVSVNGFQPALLQREPLGWLKSAEIAYVVYAEYGTVFQGQRFMFSGLALTKLEDALKDVLGRISY